MFIKILFYIILIRIRTTTTTKKQVIYIIKVFKNENKNIIFKSAFKNSIYITKYAQNLFE